MKIDLFMEFAAPPLSACTGRVVFEEGFTLARAADAAGFDTVWSVEHHFLGPYSHAAAPDMLLAAIARETQNIGLGFGVVPLPIHDPVRIAERFATLDLISEGRLRWGVGRGVTVTELEGFGISPSDSRAVFLERLATLRTILETGAFEREGQSYKIEPDPRHVRKDGWLAAVSPETFDLAAELGLGAMAGPFKPWPMVRSDLARYRRLCPSGETSFAIAVYCGPDARAARRRAEPGLVWAYRKILEIARPMLAHQISGYEHYRKLGRLTGLLERTLTLRVLEALGLAVVGDPDHVTRKLSSLQASGLDRASLIIGGGDLGVTESIDCIELLATDVLPRLATSRIQREVALA